MHNLDNIGPDVNYFSDENQCKYYTVDSSVNYTTSSNYLNIIHINIRSANGNIEEFLLNLNSAKIRFPIVILTITWLNSLSEWIDVPGYTAYHSVREGRSEGGVTLLVVCNLPSDMVSELTTNDECHETLGVNIKIGKKIYTVIGTYWPPSSSLPNFNDKYFEMLNKVGRTNIVFVAWDFFVYSLGDFPPSQVQSFLDNFCGNHFFNFSLNTSNLFFKMYLHSHFPPNIRYPKNYFRY